MTRAEAPTSQSDLRIELVESATAFAALREEWTDLLSHSTSDCLFLTWEWLHTWWTHLGQGCRLFIVTVRAEQQLVAIAPLVVCRGWAGPFSVPLLEFAGTGMIGSDYLDFIVRREREPEAVALLTNFLADTGLSMRLPRVAVDSAAAVEVTRALTARGWNCGEVPMDVCPFIDFAGRSWDAYLESLGPKHRYNFRRRLRALHKHHAISLNRAVSEGERRAMLQHLVDLHMRRWKQRGGSDAFNDPRVLAFHEEMSALANKRGWLRLSLLKLDDRPAAAMYAFRYGRVFYFYQSGFDPDLSRLSVGLVTMGLTIQIAIEEGAEEYDLLHGSESYKFLWATQVRPLVRLEAYPPGRMGRMHRHTVRVAGVTRRFAKRVLQAVLPGAPVTTSL